MNLEDITGERLILRHVPPLGLAATIAGDMAEVSRLIGLDVPAEWSELVPLARRRIAQIETDPSYLPWSIRAVALRDTQEVVGYANFHEAPGPEYLRHHASMAVELGYTIFVGHRRRGYGGEAVRLLIRWAKARGADGFVFSVSPGNVPSLALVTRLGAVKVGAHIDEEDGPEDEYLLKP